MQTLLRRNFRPEFLNRLDEIVFYKPLSKENITGIIDLQIAALNKRLADKQLKCELTPAAKSFVIDAAYDPQFGARPLRRYLQHTVETLLAQRILRGDVLPGQTLVCDEQNGELVISLRQGMKNSGPFRPGVFYGKTHGRTAHPSPNGCYTRYPDSQLRNGNLAAHRVDCLVLLGSPPDTVHRALLRKTRSSTPLIRVRRHSIHPRSGIPPRCSGLRVTGHRYLPK